MSIGSLGNGGAWSGMQRLQPPSRDELLRDVDAREGGVAASELRTIRATPTDNSAAAAQDDTRQALLKQPFPWMPSTLPGPFVVLQDPKPSDDAETAANDQVAEGTATNTDATAQPALAAAAAAALTPSQGTQAPQDTPSLQDTPAPQDTQALQAGQAPQDTPASRAAQAPRAEASFAASLSTPASRPGPSGLPADRLPSPAAEHYAAAGGQPLPATVGQRVNVAV